jgi:hypothetical protein
MQHWPSRPHSFRQLGGPKRTEKNGIDQSNSYFVFFRDFSEALFFIEHVW